MKLNEDKKDSTLDKNKNSLKFNPSSYESEIESFWKKNNFFRDWKNIEQLKESKKPLFSILMPPPNVTGKLHLGHAWDSYYPDMLIRYKQLKGFNTIWYSGMDHAGIATQVKVEERLLKQFGKTKDKFKKEDFLKYAWEWKDEYALEIEKQWESLGLALNYKDGKLDQDFFRFTLEPRVNKIVNEVFGKLYNQDLIYKDKKMINWDVVLKTAISNIEVEFREVNTKLYFIKYKIEETDDFLIVSTTRPETIWGDQAIFLNPKDSRANSLKNKFVINPLNSQKIPILFDEYVDMEFGTGVMKCTPAHDFEDYKLAKKHHLKFVDILNDDGTLNDQSGFSKGQDRIDSRVIIIGFLKKENLVEKIEDYRTSIGFSQRTNSIVEPKISEQWFLKASLLAKECLKNQEDIKTKIDFFPKRFEKDFLKWVEETEDWCISRQLWWGHQIPIWNNKDNKQQFSEISPGKDWEQDQSVLDTWFSSSLWPMSFSIEKENFKVNNKLITTLFTGYDIIFFWVSRMIFMTLKIDGISPFEKVIIHGLIRDSQGRKMSKSLGNGIDPFDVINKWGSDSLRGFLLGNSTPGQDIKYHEQKIIDLWDLQNKLWNANILIKSFFNLKINLKNLNKDLLNDLDKFVLSKLHFLNQFIEPFIENYELNKIYKNVNEFIYDIFTNFYLDLIKVEKNEIERITFLVYIFKQILVVLHPFFPFFTEKIYQSLKEIINDLEESILQDKYLDNDFVDWSNVNSENEKPSKAKYLFEIYKSAQKIMSNKNYNKGSILIDYSSSFVLGDEEIHFINKYLKKISSKLDSTILKNNYFDIFIYPEIGMITYFSFENSKNRPKEDIIFDLKKASQFELQRALLFLSNEQNLQKASSIKINTEKNKIKWHTEALKILNNEN